ncbi:YoaK family protein [Vermiculatibacterium agrestimuris]|uniref:YoaK family protein n=1 Tax=Vermiculatibacterium agrestimuris TaxID=2941519 RepID=UPI00203A49EA|nr:YoaK family protein [Vermiculatibacterium agrestimuris]
METKRIPLAESMLFLTVVTFMGGFLDTYIYTVRNGFFPNGHTTNMAKVGIALAQGNWNSLFQTLMFPIAFVLGVIVSEIVRTVVKDRDWRSIGLLLEFLLLCGVAFVPDWVPDQTINCFGCFITAYQLCLFRKCEFGVHNTTICTGNLRSVGQFFFSALQDKSASSWMRFLKYGSFIVTFVLGSAASSLLCGVMGRFASLVGAVIVAGLYVSMILDEKKMAASATA